MMMQGDNGGYGPHTDVEYRAGKATKELRDNMQTQIDDLKHDVLILQGVVKSLMEIVKGVKA